MRTGEVENPKIKRMGKNMLVGQLFNELTLISKSIKQSMDIYML